MPKTIRSRFTFGAPALPAAIDEVRAPQPAYREIADGPRAHAADETTDQQLQPDASERGEREIQRRFERAGREVTVATDNPRSDLVGEQEHRRHRQWIGEPDCRHRHRQVDPPQHRQRGADLVYEAYAEVGEGD